MPQPQLTTALTACSKHQPYVCGPTGLCFYGQKWDVPLGMPGSGPEEENTNLSS